MYKSCNLKTIVIITIFLLGLIYYTQNNLNNPSFIVENFENNDSTDDSNKKSLVNTSRCPNLLVQRGAKLFLENTKIEKVPGVNPIEFNNLEEYKEFINWQHSQGIYCPVLFLQAIEGADGSTKYHNQPSPFEPMPGLNPSEKDLYPKQPASLNFPYNDTGGEFSLLYDAARNDLPYNKNSYPGFDQDNQYIGLDVPIDFMKTPNTDPRVNRYKSNKKKSKTELNALMNERLQERDELIGFKKGNESNRLVDNNPLNRNPVKGIEFKETTINEFIETN